MLETLINSSSSYKKKQKELFLENFDMTPAQVKALGIRHIKSFVRELCKKDYELTRLQNRREYVIERYKKNTYGGLFVGFRSGSRSYYYSGCGSIVINLSTASWRAKCGSFDEYKRYAKNPTYGSCKISHWREAFALVCAHEFAHCVATEFANYRFTRKERDVPHGKCFQLYLKHLRKEVVNQRLESKYYIDQ